jgi:hypothetical protein
MPDPLSEIDEPEMPGVADPPESLDSPQVDIPDECPGSGDNSEATVEDPAVCTFGPGMAGTSWRLSPGLYPGGLSFQGGTFYLEPGIYWIGGGGISMNAGGDATLISVRDSGMDPCEDDDEACGVMIFNSEIAGVRGGEAEDVHLNGGNADTFLHPLDDDPYAGIVFFQDRRLEPQPELQLNGASTDMEVRGTIYSAGGHVRANGNAGDIVTDQIIANTHNLNGRGGAITALKDNEFIYRRLAAGLVE